MIPCAAMRAAHGPIKIGVAGLGAIGRQVCRAIDAGLPGLALAGATARTRDRAESFLATLKSRPAFLDVDALVEASDLVVEASTQAHLVELAPKVLAAGRDLVVLSCGALLGREDWVALAERSGARIRVPSAAIAGLDGVKGAAIGEITSVTMESRKPPKGLAGAPWIVQQKIDLDDRPAPRPRRDPADRDLEMGGLDGPPKPPMAARGAPAKPSHPSISRSRGTLETDDRSRSGGVRSHCGAVCR